MHKHHEDSIERMREYYRADPHIIALFLIGSVATGTERPDSDLDGVAVVSPDYYDEKVSSVGTMEVVHGKCTYSEGYFDIHFITKDIMRQLVSSGSETMRNMFSCAKPLFCDDEELIGLAKAITAYPQGDKDQKLKQYYCNLKMYYQYYWKACKPEGYARHHVADGMIYSLYRLILIENEILYPSFRKIEMHVISAANKPADIVEKCHRLMNTLSDEDCLAIVDSYESWTSYKFPTDHAVISNTFRDPYDM